MPLQYEMAFSRVFFPRDGPEHKKYVHAPKSAGDRWRFSSVDITSYIHTAGNSWAGKMVYCARWLLSNQPILASRLPSNLSFALAFLSLWGRASAAGLNEIRPLFPHVRLLTDEKRMRAVSYIARVETVSFSRCEWATNRLPDSYWKG